MNDRLDGGTDRTLTEERVRAEVGRIVLRMAPDRSAPATGGARLIEELGYHSLALLELVFAVEETFELRPILEQVAREIRTAADLEDHVVRELREAGRLA